MVRRVMFVVALFVAVPLHAQQVTLEGLLSAPFPSELSAAPVGGHVAWVQNARGSRNVWVATAPDFKARQMTFYSGDDGQEITALTWTPDGKSLLYVRGGGPNRQNEIPNPALAPEATEQAIWAVDVDGGSATDAAQRHPRKLATGSAPEVSPSGQVVYISRGQIWSADLAGTQKPTQLLTIRGQARDLRWSPDGRKLAFVSSRGDHSFIGVYDMSSKSLRYLDPSVDQDGNPAWSPDGTRIAFTRLPATRENFSFAPRREGEPWSIRVADVASGNGREVWTADRGAGSIFQGVSARNQVFWAERDRLVFPWERSGWLNLYSVGVSADLGQRFSGAKATALTPGNFEVEHVTLSPDRRTVIYSSNQGDIDRRHIWTVPVEGGEATPLTTGPGVEWLPAAISDGASIAFLRSDGKRAAHAAILERAAIVGRKGTARPMAPETMPAEFPATQLVEPQPVTITATDGMAIPAQLFLPRDLKAGERRPAVLFFHGGSRRQMLLGWHHMSYYHHTYAMNQYLASRGYLVLSVNYRSGTGYGLNFREALNYGATGASEFNDVLGAGLYMKSRPDVDPQRIGVYGGSYGGYLTAHALARASDLFAAGVDIHGVHDWNVGIRTFIPTYNPGPEIERRNFSASPLAHIGGWRSPVLLIHGDDDRNVSFAETVALAEALRKQGVTFEQLVLPDEIHGFLRHESWVRVFSASTDFFDRCLKGKKTGTN